MLPPPGTACAALEQGRSRGKGSGLLSESSDAGFGSG
jgi:hypothetical protein